ncbi:hypothetical protein [Sphingomonas sp.]|uniref:hypothetical protein n=1 Tax=Sphingomonas sp. TaxID=28214 RepID=UPI0025D88338|nr:hypothetical protein [Sphingomonas sp.]
MARIYLYAISSLALASCNAAKSDEPQGQGSNAVWHRATGALDDDCKHIGVNPDGGVQFISTCPQTSISPDKRWTLVQTPAIGPEEAYEVHILASDGTKVGSVPGLNDGMPFDLHWSPRPNWFFVNHHVGSFLDRPEVYEITRGTVAQRPAMTLEGLKQARRISPCLPNPDWDWATGLAYGWSRDGRKIAWLFTTRPDACVGLDHEGEIPPEKQWKSFYMISDAETGAIVSGSIRIDKSEGPAELPSDGPYYEFRPGNS